MSSEEVVPKVAEEVTEESKEVASPPVSSDTTETETKEGKKNTLLTPWTLWTDKKMTTKSTHKFEDYNQNLRNLGTFDTVEGFWR